MWAASSRRFLPRAVLSLPAARYVASQGAHTWGPSAASLRPAAAMATYSSHRTFHSSRACKHRFSQLFKFSCPSARCVRARLLDWCRLIHYEMRKPSYCPSCRSVRTPFSFRFSVEPSFFLCADRSTEFSRLSIFLRRLLFPSHHIIPTWISNSTILPSPAFLEQLTCLPHPRRLSSRTPSSSSMEMR